MYRDRIQTDDSDDMRIKCVPLTESEKLQVTDTVHVSRQSFWNFWFLRCSWGGKVAAVFPGEGHEWSDQDLEDLEGK